MLRNYALAWCNMDVRRICCETWQLANSARFETTMGRSWNFGRLKQGVPQLAVRGVRIKRVGQIWTATYHTEGDRLHVSSAWGSRSEPIGRTTDLGARATVLLNEIVGEWKDAEYA